MFATNEHLVTSISDGNDPKIPSIPMVASGFYLYKIRVELTNGAFLSYKGVVNLLR